jgi:hypothetical protein
MFGNGVWLRCVLALVTCAHIYAVTVLVAAYSGLTSPYKIKTCTCTIEYKWLSKARLKSLLTCGAWPPPGFTEARNPWPVTVGERSGLLKTAATCYNHVPFRRPKGHIDLR